jgi:hypothetical protein
VNVSELRSLPLPAAVIDDDGHILASTEEWRGIGASAVPYRYGDVTLVVAPPADGQEARDAAAHIVLDKLLDAVTAAAAAVDPVRRRRFEVLAEGLAVTAGRVARTEGTTDDVLAYLEATLPARTDVHLTVQAPIICRVAAPAAVSNALLQMMVNAAQHAKARELELEIIPMDDQVSFRLQWDGPPPLGAPIRSSRAQRETANRNGHGTGMAAARIFADAVGASITGLLDGIDPATGARDASRTRIQLDTGATDLALPVARVDHQLVAWSTRAWFEEMGSATGAPLPERIAPLLAMARREPGRIVHRDAFTARAVGQRTWFAQPPDDMGERSRMAVRFLEHEHTLGAAPSPHPQRLRSLCHFLLFLLGDDLPYVTPAQWNEQINAELAAYGGETPDAGDGPIAPVDAEELLHPMLAAYLIAEYGDFLEGWGKVLIRVRPEHADDPFIRLLTEGRTFVTLTPS